MPLEGPRRCGGYEIGPVTVCICVVSQAPLFMLRGGVIALSEWDLINPPSFKWSDWLVTVGRRSVAGWVGTGVALEVCRFPVLPSPASWLPWAVQHCSVVPFGHDVLLSLDPGCRSQTGPLKLWS